MKFCYITLPITVFGGAERLIAEEIKHFHNRGDEIHVITPDYLEKVLAGYGFPDDVTFHTHGTPSFFEDVPKVTGVAKRTRFIRTRLNEIDPDVVFNHFNHKSTELALRLSSADPAVFPHVHGTFLWFPDMPQREMHDYPCLDRLIDEVPGHTEFYSNPNLSLTDYIKTAFGETIERTFHRRSDGIVVDSEQVRRELECLYNVSAHVIRPGVRESYIGGDGVELADFDFERTILSISRLDPRKRLDVVIRALPDILDEHPDTGFVIGGEGPDKQRLQQIAEQEGVADAVQFHGHVDDDVIRPYYAGADVFVAPGWISYGIAPLEAYAQGTPIALSTDAFANEVLGSESGVRVVPPEETAWGAELAELLRSEPATNPTAVPTWETYLEEKTRIVDAHA